MPLLALFSRLLFFASLWLHTTLLSLYLWISSLVFYFTIWGTPVFCCWGFLPIVHWKRFHLTGFALGYHLLPCVRVGYVSIRNSHYSVVPLCCFVWFPFFLFFRTLLYPPQFHNPFRYSHFYRFPLRPVSPLPAVECSFFIREFFY